MRRQPTDTRDRSECGPDATKASTNVRAEHGAMPARRLIVIGVILVIAVAGVLLVRRALNPEAIRGLAESQLGSLLGQKVQIGSMTVSILPPVVTGEAIKVGNAQADASQMLGLRGLRVVPSLSSLLSSTIVIDRMDLEGLNVTIERDGEGRWLLPFGRPPATAPKRPPAPPGPKAPAVKRPPPPAAGRSVDVRRFTLKGGTITIADRGASPGAATSAQIGNVDADVTQGADGVIAAALTATVGTTKVTGSVNADKKMSRLHLTSDSVKGADLTTILALLGTKPPGGLTIDGRAPLQLDIQVGSNGVMTASGTLGAQTLKLGTLTLSDVQAPLKMERNVIALDPLVFRAYNGNHRGRLAVDVNESPARWTLTSRVEGVDIDQMLSANTSAKDRLLGVAALSADLQGVATPQSERALRGSVDAAIAHGVIKNLPLLATLNSALQLTGGSRDDTEFESLTAKLSFADGVARTDNLRLKAGEVTIVAAGTLSVDQQLAVRGRAVFSPAKSEEIIKRVHEMASMRNAKGEVELPIGVTGTIADPNISVDLSKAVKAALTKEFTKSLKKMFKIK